MASGASKSNRKYHILKNMYISKNVIVCISGNKINHFPMSHAVCTMAKAAVCGFWGQVRMKLTMWQEND